MSLYLALKPAVVLSLGEGTSQKLIVSCAGFNGNFAINTIPTMSVTVAADAVNMRTGATVGSSDFTTFSESTPATVWCQLNYPDLYTSVWLKLFVGEFAGFDIKHGNSSAAYVISLRHELAYLNYVSAISATNHPGNPTDYAFPAVATYQGAGSTLETRTWLPAVDESLVTPVGLSDLWTNILQRWLLAIANEDPFDLELRTTADLALNTNLSAKVAATLAKITIAPGIPLGLPTDSAGDAIVDNIADSLLAKSANASNDFVTMTMWTKLLGEWSPEFLFDIIPRAEGAWVVPSTGALNANVFGHLEIGYAELTDIHLYTPLDQELQAVLLLVPSANLTGYDGTAVPDHSSRSGAYGLFKPSADKSGVVIIRRAPDWLTRCDLTSAYAAELSESGQTVTSLDGTQVSTAGPALQTRAQSIRTGMVNLADRYAQQTYINERLKGRMAKLTGIFRTDICPGSHVRFKSRHSNVTYVGRVIQVSIMMDAESLAVGTVLLLSHVRTAIEDEGSGFSMKTTIMYPNLFVHGTLADADVPPDVITAAVSTIL